MSINFLVETDALPHLPFGLVTENRGGRTFADLGCGSVTFFGGPVALIRSTAPYVTFVSGDPLREQPDVLHALRCRDNEKRHRGLQSGPVRKGKIRSVLCVVLDFGDSVLNEIANADAVTLCGHNIGSQQEDYLPQLALSPFAMRLQSPFGFFVGFNPGDRSETSERRQPIDDGLGSLSAVRDVQLDVNGLDGHVQA